MYSATLKVPAVRPRTLCLCWKHTYLCSDHLVPGEFGTLRSVRKTRTSFWSRSRRISLKPFRWRVFCLLPLQKDEKRTAIQLNPNNYGAMKTAVTSVTFFFFPHSSSLLVMLPHFLPLFLSRCQLLEQISATCGFVFLSVYFSRQMTVSSICALLQILCTCSTLLPLVPFKALNPPNPWHYIEIVYCGTFPELSHSQAIILALNEDKIQPLPSFKISHPISLA